MNFQSYKYLFKYFLFLSFLLISGFQEVKAVSGFPDYDHVVIVAEENHGYAQIVGSPFAPFINKTLIKGGVLITNAYGEQHPSQPNYFWLFSGSNQGITTDGPYWPADSGGEPMFSTSNLYVTLEDVFGSNFFGAYVDSGTNTPISDYYVNTSTYASKHVPWLGFTNINKGNPAGITQDFGTTFSQITDYSTLPKVSWIIPGLNHDMHSYNNNGTSVNNSIHNAMATSKGDSWLKKNISKYATWAKTHNSLLIITWDEDSTSDWPTPKKQGGNGINGGVNPEGLTAPNLSFQATASTSGPNQIAMIFFGDHLKNGKYKLSTAVNNINLLRTIEAFYDLTHSGYQSELAIEAGLTDGPITGIFQP
jgi:hypothetical protein